MSVAFPVSLSVTISVLKEIVVQIPIAQGKIAGVCPVSTLMVQSIVIVNINQQATGPVVPKVSVSMATVVLQDVAVMTIAEQMKNVIPLPINVTVYTGEPPAVSVAVRGKKPVVPNVFPLLPVALTAIVLGCIKSVIVTINASVKQGHIGVRVVMVSVGQVNVAEWMMVVLVVKRALTGLIDIYVLVNHVRKTNMAIVA